MFHSRFFGVLLEVLRRIVYKVRSNRAGPVASTPVPDQSSPESAMVEIEDLGFAQTQVLLTQLPAGHTDPG